MKLITRVSARFWIGAALLAAAALVLLGSLVVEGRVALRALAMAAFIAALAARFLSYELQDPGFSRARSVVVAGILAAIVGLSFRIPDRAAVSLYFIAALLVLGNTAGDVWGLWRKRRLAR